MNQTPTEARPPSRWKLPVVALVVVVALILGVTVLRRTPNIVTAAPVTGQDSIVDTRPAPMASVSAQGIANDTLGKMDSSSANLLNGQDRARVKAEAEARQRAYAAQYAQESVDASWASAKEAKMLEASKSGEISQLNAEPGDLNIDCKTSLCKIQANFASHGQAEDWLTLFSTTLGGEMPKASFQYLSNPDGTTEVVIYGVSRK